MLYLLFSLFVAVAEEPDASITVTGTKYEEVFFEEPKILCSQPCLFDKDTSIIFVEVNRHHRSWFTAGEITGIYNEETIKFNYDCDFKKDVFACANQNGLLVIRTIITQTPERASINLMLFDETATMIGQGNHTKLKRTRVIERKKIIQRQIPRQPMYIESCNKETGVCATIPVMSGEQNLNQIEDLGPMIIDIPPIITARDISQAVIIMYNSVRP